MRTPVIKKSKENNGKNSSSKTETDKLSFKAEEDSNTDNKVESENG